MPYTPHTKSDISEMLDVIGLEKEENLFDSVPEDLKVSHLNLPDGLDEFSTFAKFKKLSTKNDTSKAIFLGGGYYDHVIPSAVDALSSRSEFLYSVYSVSSRSFSRDTSSFI